MSTEKTVSPVSLDEKVNIFSILSAEEVPATKPKIKAKWATLRISPNLGTGELLNVGICILYQRKVYVRILPDAKPFEILYGDSGKENFSFLLPLIAQYMEQQNKLEISISPQVSISESNFVAGESIEEIFDRLYSSMVTLDLVCRTKDKPRKCQNISTERLRERIQANIKEQDTKLLEQIWHNEKNPITIPGSPGKSVVLRHTQMWIEPDLSDERIRLASFVSTDYVNLDFSQLHLFQAKQDIELALSSITNSKRKAGLFIYRPDSLDKEIEQELDNTIDDTHWLLSKRYQKDVLEMQVESNVNTLVEHALKFAA